MRVRLRRGVGPVGRAPLLGLPGGDDLRDCRDEEQLAEDCFHDGDGLTRVGGRDQVAVAGGGESDEAEEQHLGGVAGTRWTEERGVLKYADRPVHEGEEHAFVFNDTATTENRFSV